MAMFAKRHYEAIATVLQEAHPGAGLPDLNRAIEQWLDTREMFVKLFQVDNGAFDRERFRRATVPGANVRARS